MRPIRGARRGMVPIERSAALPQHTRTVPTSAADVGIYAWPQCAECSMKKGYWVPVEGYRIAFERPSLFSIKKTAVIVAECTHRDDPDSQEWTEAKVKRQTARIDAPFYWGEAQLVKAIQSLVFFKPGQETENRMLL